MKDFLIEHIRQAGKIAQEYFVQGVTHTKKSNNVYDLLTEADTAVSAFLVDSINKQFPDHHIKSEELSKDINAGAKYEWIIDPIDGTGNFARQIPVWGVIIAILEDGKPKYGAVYFPTSDQLFFAEKGNGATLNNQKISVSQKHDLEQAIGSVYRAVENNGPYGEYFQKYREVCGELMRESNVQVVNLGCSATMVFVASGAFDFMIGNSGFDWDYVAPMLICEEAGAIVTDSEGNPWKRGRQDYIVANPNVHQKLLEFFKPGLN